MFLKVIPPGSQSFGDRPQYLIKMGSGGLRGNDLNTFIKRAGLEMAALVKQIPRLSGEELVHDFALGTTEAMGPNRNGDGFRDAVCERYHDTFMKFGRAYRNHANTDPAKSYGLVKLSYFNRPMQRVELIVAYNATKEAAQRNNGLVADKELEKLAKDEELPTSMSCRVTHDICSHCGNKARNRSEYCLGTAEGGTCKAGGLRHNMGAVLDDGTILHADNPDPVFFDISHVWRPADRISYVTGLLKAASHNQHIGGAELAEALGLKMPEYLLAPLGVPARVQQQIKAASMLAESEARVAMDRSLDGYALALSGQPALATLPPIDYQYKLAQVTRALIDNRILLSPTHFTQLMSGCGHEKAASIQGIVQSYLPGIFNTLVTRSDLATQLADNPFMPDSACQESFAYWAQKQAADLSIAQAHMTQRLFRATIAGREAPQLSCRTETTKLALDSSAAAKLAYQYALYKIAFLASLPDNAELQLTSDLAALQNHVC